MFETIFVLMLEQMKGDLQYSIDCPLEEEILNFCVELMLMLMLLLLKSKKAIVCQLLVHTSHKISLVCFANSRIKFISLCYHVIYFVYSRL